MKFGFIGLGKMGGGLARNLIRAGYEVVVFDISKEAVERTLKVGGRPASSTVEAATGADCLFTSLPMPVDLENLLLGEKGLYQVMKPGATHIDVSTIDPKTARKLANNAEEKGLNFLACPLGMGPAQAEGGSEPIFSGGKKEVFDKFEDVLKKIGKPVYYTGDVEQSTAFKLISNMVGMTNMATLAEGLKLGEKVGIDPALLQELLKVTGAESFQLRVRGPWVLNKDYAPRFSVNLALKDVRLGNAMADDLGMMLDLCKKGMGYLAAAQENGYGDEDCNAVFKVVR